MKQVVGFIVTLLGLATWLIVAQPKLDEANLAMATYGPLAAMVDPDSLQEVRDFIGFWNLVKLLGMGVAGVGGLMLLSTVMGSKHGPNCAHCRDAIAKQS
jgi:hypothetical protein